MSTITAPTRLTRLMLAIATVLVIAGAFATTASAAPATPATHQEGWHWFSAHMNAYGDYGWCGDEDTAKNAWCWGHAEGGNTAPFDGGRVSFGWSGGNVFIDRYKGEEYESGVAASLNGTTTPGLPSDQLVITGGNVPGWGGVHSGTDATKTGQPGGPLHFYVGDASKPWSIGYVMDVRGYLWY